MDQLNYREVVQTIIKNHLGNSLNTNTEVQLIFDTERDHYQLLHIGWQDLHRVFGCIIIDRAPHLWRGRYMLRLL